MLVDVSKIDISSIDVIQNVNILSQEHLISDESDELLFETIAKNIADKGYSIHPYGLPIKLAEALYEELQIQLKGNFSLAGVGKGAAHQVNSFVRTDEVCWIQEQSSAGQLWMAWIQSLQDYLNSTLFLGLFSFESHFSHYSPGDFYKRHLDAFKGQSNRKLSLVVYLNPGWRHADEGELVLYLDDDETLKVTPSYATLALFLSEDFPHEVLPATRDRYSIAGWFSVNRSSAEKIDPPV